MGDHSASHLEGASQAVHASCCLPGLLLHSAAFCTLGVVSRFIISSSFTAFLLGFKSIALPAAPIDASAHNQPSVTHMDGRLRGAAIKTILFLQRSATLPARESHTLCFCLFSIVFQILPEGAKYLQQRGGTNFQCWTFFIITTYYSSRIDA